MADDVIKDMPGKRFGRGSHEAFHHVAGLNTVGWEKVDVLTPRGGRAAIDCYQLCDPLGVVGRELKRHPCAEADR